MEKYKSYDLILQPYCEFCPDFKPDVEMVDITVLSDQTPKVNTAIRCVHQGRCERIYARIKEIEHESEKI